MCFQVAVVHHCSVFITDGRQNLDKCLVQTRFLL